VSTAWLSNEARRRLEARLADVAMEHRDLDAAIQALEIVTPRDELQVRRMKKRKLGLKDEMTWLERQLQPDEHA
jgi:hypothetical protein